MEKLETNFDKLAQNYAKLNQFYSWCKNAYPKVVAEFERLEQKSDELLNKAFGRVI